MQWKAYAVSTILAATAIGGVLMSSPTQGALASDAPVTLELRSDAMLLRHGDSSLRVSLASPVFALDDRTVGAHTPVRVTGTADSGSGVELAYEPIALDGSSTLEVRQSLKWSPKERVLRKWADYRIVGPAKPALVEEIVLETLDPETSGAKMIAEQPVIWPPQSYPVFLDGYFAGVEFPVSATRIESSRVILAHRPGIRIAPGEWHRTRVAVYGCAARGSERRAFQRYVMAHSPGASRRMFSWEPWVTMPIPYLESDHLEMLGEIEDNLYKRHGVSIDSCVMTAGWSDPQSIWEIDAKRFPDGFSKARTASERMGCRMGLWISPCSFYSFALDTNWAKEHGYETAMVPGGSYRVACLGGRKYQSAFKERVLGMFGRYDVAYAYFDGYLFQCTEPDHGHEPGDLSPEPIAEGFLDVIASIRKIKPDAWLEATCFGGNASPWWLFHVNTVLGNYGDDYCWGRVPDPIYRGSYTTARDYANLQGCVHGLLPVALQEVFAGLYNHTTEPVVDDMVMGLMRGNMLYLLCTNPKVMNDYGWAALAKSIQWGRRNVDLFRETTALLPVSWQNGKCPKFSQEAPSPREPYGYAHWKGSRGIVTLRNPWVTTQTYALRLDETSGLSTKGEHLTAVSIYPENRVYGRNLKYGDELRVTLAPYETVVLSIAGRQSTKDLPDADSQPARWVRAEVIHKRIQCVALTQPQVLQPESAQVLTGGATKALKVDLDAKLALDAPSGELLLLCEEKGSPVDPLCTVTINGKEVEPVLSGPDLGYAGTVLSRPEQWLFLRYPIPKGGGRVHVDLLTRSESPKVSVWAWASKPGDVDGSKCRNSLPQPEIISLGSALIMETIDIGSDSQPSIPMESPVERISGAYLDSLQPTSVTGAWKQNSNPWSGPLTIRGRTYLRGVGVTSPSKLTYDLAGRYRRFTARVGVDGVTAGHDKSALVLQVLVDGEKRWESPVLTRWTEPVPIDIDLSGARTLELVSDDRARPGTLDHSGSANWADGKLLF